MATGDRTSGAVHQVIPGAPPLLARRIVVWRRLEPGDVRTAGSLEVPESPFLEAKVIEIAIPQSVHEDMKRLATAKATATATSRSPLLEYEPAGVLISAAGGIGIGVWLDYLRPADVFQWIAVGSLIAGVALATFGKQRRRAQDAAAAARWASAPERKEYEDLARVVASAWLSLTQRLKQEGGFYSEIRVAEGSNDPLRLASIDPRPLEGGGGFDPEDWMPTEGGGVRYEALHAGGEIVSRLLPGAEERGESERVAEADADADATADADAKADADADAKAEAAAEAEAAQPAPVDPPR